MRGPAVDSPLGCGALTTDDRPESNGRSTRENAMATSGSILGNAVIRREDPTLVTGAGKYFDDLRFDGMLHTYFVRSPVAHARITNIDTSAAESMPGVRKVYTHANIGLADFQAFPMMPEILNRPVLCRDVVRFVGDTVVAIVAETRAQAVDAGEAVVIDYARGIGLDAIADRNRQLAADLRVALGELPGVTVRDRGAERCAIVTFTVEGHAPAAVSAALRAAGVNTSVSSRTSAQFDLAERGIDHMVRASVHYYNTAEETDRLVAELRRFIGRG
jgi:CO/xanthine dehydrogenase Mo-binding subunit